MINLTNLSVSITHFTISTILIIMIYRIHIFFFLLWSEFRLGIPSSYYVNTQNLNNGNICLFLCTWFSCKIRNLRTGKLLWNASRSCVGVYVCIFYGDVYGIGLRPVVLSWMIFWSLRLLCIFHGMAERIIHCLPKIFPVTILIECNFCDIGGSLFPSFIYSLDKWWLSLCDTSTLLYVRRWPLSVQYFPFFN